VASILGPAIHLGNLYAASQISEVLNAAAGDAAIDATTLLRAFSNDASDAFVFSHPDDRSVICICRKKMSERHGGNELSIGRSASLAEA
jgi:hypothetical protein